MHITPQLAFLRFILSHTLTARNHLCPYWYIEMLLWANLAATESWLANSWPSHIRKSIRLSISSVDNTLPLTFYGFKSNYFRNWHSIIWLAFLHSNLNAMITKTDHITDQLVNARLNIAYRYKNKLVDHKSNKCGPSISFFKCFGFVLIGILHWRALKY